MLEQELASIFKFVLDASGNPAPYYYSIPENFMIPAAYFPTPEIATDGETFRTFRMNYSWYIKFFHSTEEEAYALALAALLAIRSNRNIIPLIGTDGQEIGEGLRVNDPSIKKLDEGAAQIVITFASRRPYGDPVPEKMQVYDVTLWEHSDLYQAAEISEEDAAAVSAYLQNEE